MPWFPIFGMPMSQVKHWVVRESHKIKLNKSMLIQCLQNPCTGGQEEQIRWELGSFQEYELVQMCDSMTEYDEYSRLCGCPTKGQALNNSCESAFSVPTVCHGT
jgi:hypothetical protein